LKEEVVTNELGLTLSQEMRAWLGEMDAPTLATYMTGGLTFGELPREFKAMEVMISQSGDFVLFPLPNQMFTRDTSCWIYNGVTLNPMYWPARRQETLNIAAIYRFHPAFKDAQFEYWYGDVEEDHGKAHVSNSGDFSAHNLVKSGCRWWRKNISGRSPLLFSGTARFGFSHSSRSLPEIDSPMVTVAYV
jgi:arginine deiminase